MPNLKSVGLETKELLRFHSGCHGMKISFVSNRHVVSAARDLVPTSKRPLPFPDHITSAVPVNLDIIVRSLGYVVVFVVFYSI